MESAASVLLRGGLQRRRRVEVHPRWQRRVSVARRRHPRHGLQILQVALPRRARHLVALPADANLHRCLGVQGLRVDDLQRGGPRLRVRSDSALGLLEARIPLTRVLPSIARRGEGRRQAAQDSPSIPVRLVERDVLVLEVLVARGGEDMRGRELGLLPLAAGRRRRCRGILDVGMRQGHPDAHSRDVVARCEADWLHVHVQPAAEAGEVTGSRHFGEGLVAMIQDANVDVFVGRLGRQAMPRRQAAPRARPCAHRVGVRAHAHPAPRRVQRSAHVGATVLSALPQDPILDDLRCALPLRLPLCRGGASRADGSTHELQSIRNLLAGQPALGIRDVPMLDRLLQLLEVLLGVRPRLHDSSRADARRDLLPFLAVYPEGVQEEGVLLAGPSPRVLLSGGHDVSSPARGGRACSGGHALGCLGLRIAPRRRAGNLGWRAHRPGALPRRRLAAAAPAGSPAVLRLVMVLIGVAEAPQGQESVGSTSEQRGVPIARRIVVEVPGEAVPGVGRVSYVMELRAMGTYFVEVPFVFGQMALHARRICCGCSRCCCCRSKSLNSCLGSRSDAHPARGTPSFSTAAIPPEASSELSRPRWLRPRVVSAPQERRGANRSWPKASDGGVCWHHARGALDALEARDAQAFAKEGA
mmetsp:Transcript_4623/g.18414  ORF Transcript_4623/g.18414 Transcript_4623/m.18414 type:complete len:643 (-) Transcript_4623:236-2164(-)